MKTEENNKTGKKKSTSVKKKEYKGVAIRKFGFKGVQYEAGDSFSTKEKKYYDNLINIKRIK